MDPKQALLQQLEDIQAPEALGFWPPAPGWWLLAFILLGLGTAAVISFIQFRQRTAYRRQALKILHKIEAARNKTSNEHNLQQLQALLKRTVLTAYKYSRPKLASLYGKNFYKFLGISVEAPHQSIDPRWHDALYRKELLEHHTFPLTHFFEFTRFWIKKHKALKPIQVDEKLKHCGLLANTPDENEASGKHSGEFRHV